MDLSASLIRMLQQLLQDMHAVQQLGAGYYSCTPITQRYNKLLGQARAVFGEEDGLIATFDDGVESEPNDPADKMKVLQGVRIEIGQLIALLESVEESSAQEESS